MWRMLCLSSGFLDETVKMYLKIVSLQKFRYQFLSLEQKIFVIYAYGVNRKILSI